MGESTRQAMEYEEESVHNVLTAARNAVVSVAKKVEDNILHVMTACWLSSPPSAMHEDPRSQSTRHPAKGAQCPGHQLGMYAYRQAQGGQAMA